MSIELHNQRLTNRCEVMIHRDESVRGGVNHEEVARIRRYYDINGLVHPFRIKRQLAKTRHTCKTIRP